MGETSLEPLKAILERIREQADFALNLKRSVQCGGNAKTVDTLSISLGPFH